MSPIKSPGAPSHRREIERAFWVEIARGLSSENAATTVGVSPVVGARWFRRRGGMSPFVNAPPTVRYLSFDEREQIALPRVQDTTVHENLRTLVSACAWIADHLAGDQAASRVDSSQPAAKSR